MAESVQSNDGVYFIPGFSGLGPPINDYKAAAGFFGLKPTTNKPHLVRAILESIVFRVVQLFDVVSNETNFTYNRIRIDGGVSKNDFICQLLSDMTEVTVERSESSELSALGAAYLAGLTAGVWKNRDDIKRLRKLDREFCPNEKSTEINRDVLDNWSRVIERFKNWYENDINSDVKTTNVM